MIKVLVAQVYNLNEKYTHHMQFSTHLFVLDFVLLWSDRLGSWSWEYMFRSAQLQLELNN